MVEILQNIYALGKILSLKISWQDHYSGNKNFRKTFRQDPINGKNFLQKLTTSFPQYRKIGEVEED